MNRQTTKRELIRRKIIEFVKNEIDRNNYLGRVELERKFHVDFRSYFPGNIREVYESVGVDYTDIERKIIENRVRLAAIKISRFEKNNGRKIICTYIKKYVEINKFPTITDIESKFRTRINTYFKNGIKEAYNEANVKFPSRPNKSFKEKMTKRNEILKFVKLKIRSGVYVKRGQIEKHFNVDLRYYFPDGLGAIFRVAGIKPNTIRKIKRNLPNKQRKFISINKGKGEIAKYIKGEYYRNNFPTRKDIEKELSINFKSYFLSIKEAYDYAKIEKPSVLSQLMLEKERKLTMVMIKLLPKLGYEIIQINALPFKENNAGADIIVKDKKGNIIPIELKAYHRNTSLPNNIRKLDKSEDEISQLQRYIHTLNSKEGILVTTTNNIRNIHIPPNIKLVKARDLVKMMEMNNLSEHISNISWIRNNHATSNKRKYINKIKREIIDFVLNRNEKGHFPKRIEIERGMNIDVRTYFPGGIKEIYAEANMNSSLKDFL